MEKTKVIMHINSYHKGYLILYISDMGVQSRLKSLTELCNKKHGGYVKLELSAPYPPRTTGVGSQNNKIWGMITQICRKTGYSVDNMEEYAKKRATVRGYPYTVNPLTGDIKYASMTEISTVEASYLIEELYVIAAESGVDIYEG